MANVLIEILDGGDPRPSPASLQHGDTVTFQVEGDQAVSVTFNTPCCLVDSAPLSLDGSNALTASCSPRAVSPLATKTAYAYSVEVTRASSSSVRKVGGELEAKQGEMDVTTDPPEEDKKR